LPFFLLWFFALCANAQTRHDANWCFGEGAGMHFNEDGTVDIFHCETSNSEANATFSSEDGELLFYLALNYYTGQGKKLLLGNNQLMDNGDGLETAYTITSGGAFVPIEGDSMIDYYYLGLSPDSLQLGYYLNLKLAKIVRIGNSYSVSTKNLVVVNTALQEKLAMTKALEPNC
jgi:hypothetical protein